MPYFKTEVISNQQLASDIFVIKTGWSEQSVGAGQFFMIKAWKNELPLMRPISVFKKEKHALSFMYRVVGKGTELLRQLKVGDEITLLGPSGNGFPCGEVSGKIALVGGGVGIPPLYETAKTLLINGNQVDIYLGFKEEIFAVEDFQQVCTNLYIATETGAYGAAGFITDIIDVTKYDALFTCGPEAMMIKLAEQCYEKNVKCWLSIEKRMGCGIGACLVCNCKTNKGMMRTCKDGPIFSAEMFF
ncbi:MAG: dihydroorotate dehydrogenase electron transfer subunit [Bacteroidales bacterium]|jgi:dihydroorotate dehydrogenase electron transfer subunit|nr:dihydroorotate dehydrogenase electron transfer subunit [Bacteroidales bacterium]